MTNIIDLNGTPLEVDEILDANEVDVQAIIGISAEIAGHDASRMVTIMLQAVINIVETAELYGDVKVGEKVFEMVSTNTHIKLERKIEAPVIPKDPKSLN